MVPPNPRFSRNVPTKIAMLAGDVLNFGTCHLGLHFFGEMVYLVGGFNPSERY